MLFRKRLAHVTAFFLLGLHVVASALEPGLPWSGMAEPVFRRLVPGSVSGATNFAEDGQGFLWMGGPTGLARWDGYRFKSYAPDTATPDAMPDNYILALHTDPAGRLWIGSISAGLARYDPIQDRFVSYPTPPGGPRHLSVESITDDGAGGLWLGTGTGLAHLDANAATPQRQFPELSGRSVPALVRDEDGTLWAGTSQGLARRASGSNYFTPVPLPAQGDGVPSVLALLEDSQGRLWIGTRSHGAFVIDPGSPTARRVVENGPSPSLSSDRVVDILEVAEGKIWIATHGAGILSVDTSSWRMQRIRSRQSMPFGLSDDDLRAMYRDRSGHVWVSTTTTLNQHDPQAAIATVFGASGREGGVTHANVPAMLALPDGLVWAALGDGGVDLIDPARGRIAQLRPDSSHPLTALPKGQILSMAHGHDGRVYLGTQQGLYVADSRAKDLRRLALPGRNALASVTALRFDARQLWLGGLDGLWSYELDSGGEPRQGSHYGQAELGDQRITAIQTDARDAIWVGTRLGVVRIDKVTGAPERMPVDSTDPSALVAGYVASLVIDRQERLWVATFGGGIQLLLPRRAIDRPRFRRLGTRDGLPSEGVDMLIEAADGQLWASTENGLAVLDEARWTAHPLQGPDGVALLAYWTNSGGVTPGGELLFGAVGGVTIVRPWLRKERHLAAPLAVTEVQVNGRTLPTATLNRQGGQRIVMSPTDRSLQVEFTLLDLSAPERNTYAYRLEGFDTDWIATSASRRIATYTNLPPGDYRLRLRGAGRDGRWREAASAIMITVQPAWSQALWFRTLAVLAALFAVAAFVHARTIMLRRRQQELQGLVRERTSSLLLRTAELEARTAELRQSETQLRQLAYQDPLTHLPNRRLFNEDLRQLCALAGREQRPFCLLLIDLDGFKAINDSAGHDAGDALLVAFATSLRGAVRTADRVARLGGDEFAVLMPETSDETTIGMVCARVIAAASVPVPFHAHVLRSGASVGVALSPKNGIEPDTLYKAADLALYQAKREGRNRWRSSAEDTPGPGLGDDTAASGLETDPA